MDPENQLIVIIEVAVALAGFAGIVATFQFKDDRRVIRGDVLGFALMISISLVCALFASATLVLLNFGLSKPLVWAYCSGALAVTYLIINVYTIMGITRIKNQTRLSRVVWVGMVLVSLLIFIMLIMNVLGIVFDRQYAPYFLSLTSPLIVVGILFARLLLRPTMRRLRNQNRRRGP